MGHWVVASRTRLFYVGSLAAGEPVMSGGFAANEPTARRDW